jgi:hypothetical protein
MTHIGMFHHFLRTALIKLFKLLDGSLRQMETKSVPHLRFRGFQIFSMRGNCSERKPGVAGLSCHGTAD